MIQLIKSNCCKGRHTQRDREETERQTDRGGGRKRRGRAGEGGRGE